MVPKQKEPLKLRNYFAAHKCPITFAAPISDTTSELALYCLVAIQKKTTMANTLALITAKALPALSGSIVTYDPTKNAFLTPSYVSQTGNAYHKQIRLSNRLIICYNIGKGYAHTFLNGITLFCFDGRRAKMIAQKLWGSYDWRCFSEYFAREQSIIMLKNYLVGQAKLLGKMVSEQQMLAFSREMVDATNRYLTA